MKAPDEKLVELLQQSKTLLVVSHVNPDADAYGSSCGLMIALQARGKRVDCFNVDGAVERFHFLPGVSTVQSSLKDQEQYDCIVVCDCGDRKRVGDGIFERLQGFGVPIVNIDHHISNELFGTLNHVQIDTASTSELIFQILNSLGYEIPGEAAQCLLAGIIGDTGSFRYSNTTAETFETAAILLRAGANPSEIARGLYSAFPVSAIKLQAEAMRDLKLHFDGQVAEVLVTQEMFMRYSSNAEYTDFLVERARDIQGVRASFFIREDGDFWKVSMRAQPETWNVSEIATSFGGGGHIQAAGFRYRGDLQTLRTRILEAFSRIPE